MESDPIGSTKAGLGQVTLLGSPVPEASFGSTSMESDHFVSHMVMMVQQGEASPFLYSAKAKSLDPAYV